MHDSASHNSNAIHDNADINNEGDVDDVHADDDNNDDDVSFIMSGTKPGGKQIVGQRGKVNSA